MTSKLESMRRELNSALAVLNNSNKNKDTKPNADDPAVRLKSLEKEVGSTLSEVHDIRGKNDRAEKFDPTLIDRLEAQVAELAGRVRLRIKRRKENSSVSLAVVVTINMLI